MIVEGRCHCGAVSYVAQGAAEHHTLCHCTDCRRWSGAPMCGWLGYKADQVAIIGETVDYASSEHGRREFCPTCGTGMFYRNEVVLPGMIDIPSGTLDDPGAVPPSAHIMASERLAWMDGVNSLPEFRTYPGME